MKRLILLLMVVSATALAGDPDEGAIGGGWKVDDETILLKAMERVRRPNFASVFHLGTTGQNPHSDRLTPF